MVPCNNSEEICLWFSLFARLSFSVGSGTNETIGFKQLYLIAVALSKLHV